MSKLSKIREILFDKTEFVCGELTLQYGKVKSAYIKLNTEGNSRQQHLFLLADINHMVTVCTNERCYCDIKLNSGVVISIYGTSEEVEYLFRNLHSRWIDFKNESEKFSLLKTTMKFAGVILFVFMLATVISKKSGTDSLAASNIPTIAPSVVNPENPNKDTEENLLASKISQQARPNAELSALLKKGAATNDYSVKIGDSTQTKSVFYVFSDPLCPHCRNIEPVLEKLADDYTIHIFPVSKIGREKSIPIVETVLCSNPEERAGLWKEAVSGHFVTDNSCPVGNTALTNNNATFSAFAFIGTPTIIRNDGAVFPLTKKLNEDNLKSWLKGEF